MQRREDAVHAVPADHLYSRCPTPAKCASSLDSSIRSGLWWFAALTYSVCILGRSKSSIFERSEEHTSELQSLMRISYAVFCLKKKKTIHTTPISNIRQIVYI